MKYFAFGLTLVLVAFTLGGAAEKAEQLDELSGVIRTEEVKALSPCLLMIDGSHSIGLRGEGLEDIPDKSRIWVKGRLHTMLYDNRDDPLPAMNPLQWHIYMDVVEWKPIAAPFEKPAGGGGGGGAGGGTIAPTTQASQEDIGCNGDKPAPAKVRALPSETTLPAPALAASEKPVILLYQDSYSGNPQAPRAQVTTAVWSDGRIVWRANGGALLQSRIETKKIDTLIERLHRQGVFGDGKAYYEHGSRYQLRCHRSALG